MKKGPLGETLATHLPPASRRADRACPNAVANPGLTGQPQFAGLLQSDGIRGRDLLAIVWVIPLKHLVARFRPNPITGVTGDSPAIAFEAVVLIGLALVGTFSPFFELFAD
jgi:hypothetical protein